VVTPAVALPGEVDPFRVAELIAHKGQVAFAAQTHSQQPDHFVQGHTPVDDGILAVYFHAPVHFLVAQAEHNGLVANQRLIVGLAVADDLFFGTAGSQFVVNMPQIPMFVGNFLQQADPKIRRTHSQPVVKADAAVFDRQTQARHCGHILGDQNGVGVNFPGQSGGQLEIGDRLQVGVHRKILAVVGKGRTQTVVQIEHGGDTVEPETVKVVLLQPEFQVGQQKVDHFVFAVVETFCAPGRVVALGRIVEELVGRAVKFVNALPGVPAGVGMDHIQKHGDAHIVGGVDKVFQVLGPAEPGRCREEIGDLIAEGRIIRMLHHRHDLQGVVAQFFHSGQDILGKFGVSADFSLFLGHTDVALVDKQFALGSEAVVGPVEGFFVVDHAVPGVVVGVLDHTADIEGDPLQNLAAPLYQSQHPHTVLQGILSGKEQFKHAVFQFFQRIGGPVPAAEVAGQEKPVCAGGPFPVEPAGFGSVEAEIPVAVGKVGK